MEVQLDHLKLFESYNLHRKLNSDKVIKRRGPLGPRVAAIRDFQSRGVFEVCETTKDELIDERISRLAVMQKIPALADRIN